MTKDDFIKEISKYVVDECKKRGYGFAQAATCIAQACCESNYGQSEIMKNAHAYFGIKATPSWITAATYGGLVYNSKTKECYDGKTYDTITACFRAYWCMRDSVSDYFDLMETKRYRNSLRANSVTECITAIKLGGYATAPTYINTIVNFYTSNAALINECLMPLLEDEIPVDEVDYCRLAQAVIAGQWGNGAERKRRLTEAGYDYSKVQAEVNRLLRR